MSMRVFRDTLLVCAFLAGTLLTVGAYAENDTMKFVGWTFLLMFFGIAGAGGCQLHREYRKQRRYERSKKGLSWRG